MHKDSDQLDPDDRAADDDGGVLEQKRVPPEGKDHGSGWEDAAHDVDDRRDVLAKPPGDALQDNILETEEARDVYKEVAETGRMDVTGFSEVVAKS